MRRQLTAMFILILVTKIALADCAIGSLTVWPKTDTLLQNPVIVIDGYGSSQDIINNLNKKYPIYLISDNGHKTTLNVIEILIGEYALTQAVLQPNDKLLAGQHYSLKIDSLDKEQQQYLIRRGLPIDEWGDKKWFIKQGITSDRPKWTKGTTFLKESVQFFGCGPNVFVIFQTNISCKDPFLIKTTLYNKTTRQPSSYYLPIDKNGHLYIGNNFCSGAFKLKENNEYEISFSLMTFNGTKTNSPEQILTFKGPIIKDKIQLGDNE